MVVASNTCLEDVAVSPCKHVGGYWLRKGDRYFCHIPPVRDTIAHEKYCEVDRVSDAEMEQALREWKEARDAFLRY